jgi:CBS domain-containing protein
MKVKAAMHKGVASVQPETPVREVAKVMRRKNIGAVPVRANGKLVGIITDRDITCRALGNSGRIDALTAANVMSKKIVICSPEDDVATAIKWMKKRKIRRLPVTDKRKGLVGMLSLGDLSHKISRRLSGEMLQCVSAHHR